jgi:hypothetical protein
MVGTAHAEKDRQTAQILSGAGAGVSGALILSGFALGHDKAYNAPLMYSGLVTAAFAPSLGEIYAGQYLTWGMGARVVGVGIATIALTKYQSTSTCDNATSVDQKCTNIEGAGLALLGLAAIAYIGGIAYDVGDAGPAVDRYNARSGITVAPTALQTQSGLVPGLVVVGSF